ncbi:glycoside hydrolase family 95 protein [Botryobacter ruber]|uniref:glycoside hydrolase family 95 protein n=1 Tax=Botryobacter ruber TaxID=2171629 RepID=UPI000E0BD994|nr:glycoside hydrolase N-terminal domain-containing protein [Botryobacter ruber]
MKAKSFVALFLLVLTLFAFNQKQESKQDLTLWYKAPAEKWTEALALGNGRLGAMVYGGVEKDQIQFNEETLWTGEPREYAREGAVKYLPELRRLLKEGKQDEAEKLAQEHFMGRKSTEEGDQAVWEKKVTAVQTQPVSPAQPGYNDSKWEEMTLPTPDGWEKVGMEGLDGSIWFRTSFELPKKWKGKDIKLELGRVRDKDYTFVNGKLVGSTEGIGNHRRYVIPASLLKKGKNVIAVQVINYFNKGGFVGHKFGNIPISVYPEGDPSPEKNLLALNTKPWKYWVQDDNPPAVPTFQAAYQAFGDLWLNFKNHTGATDYSRELDIQNAISRTTYTLNGVTYTREYFASAPNQVVAVHLKASKPGQITFDASLNSPHKKSSTRKIDAQTLGLSLQVKNGALRGESFLKANNKGGNITVTDDKISVNGADEVTLYLTAGTNYIRYDNVSGDPAAVCRKALQSVQPLSYEQVKDAHTKEYQGYFNTLSFTTPQTANAQLPTDERIAKFASESDPSLVPLYLQFGRYLLISSSRPGTRPPNIQGIWNDMLAPPWDSKYTTNINVEMIYWPAEPLNLSPMHQPLFDMTEELATRGKVTAKYHYGAPGWVLHHNTDLWRGTAPINASNHGIWVTGGAWLSHHFWEHYLYTQDKQFLKEEAYPIMKGAAEFFTHFLVEDPETGWLISTPSNSPENGGLVAGPTMDHQLIRSLFKKTIEASQLLNTDPQFRAELQKMLPRIAPNQIGKHGQLQEWLEDKDDPDNKHRHVSHLWGMHPGDDITWQKNPKLMEAAKQSLIMRGDEGTGWSLAWKINFWARFLDGEHAYKMLQMLIHPAAKGGGSYPNMFDAHPPFQIDGNFGGAAGIAEMLVQSHDGGIDLLPALPKALPEGDIKGICARGGFVLDMKWNGGKLQSLEVTPRADNKCTLRYAGKTITFNAQKGKTYKLNKDLKLI